MHDKLGLTVIIITHQMSVVEQICTKVAILDNGEVAEIGDVSEVFSSPKSRAAKNLVYPEGFDSDILQSASGAGVIRVVFNGAEATNTPLIAQMAIDINVAASILYASTKSIGSKAYGNMMLGIPGGRAEMDKAMDYLRKMPGITVQEAN